jgi:hypothetical protein
MIPGKMKKNMKIKSKMATKGKAGAAGKGAARPGKSKRVQMKNKKR